MNISAVAYQMVAAYDQHWAIQPQKAEAILSLWSANPQALAPRGAGMGQAGGAPEGVALIEIHGVMSRAGMPCMEATSTVDVRSQIRQAIKDDSIKAIVLSIDSPGGTVAGTGDLGDEISAANQVKPVYAYVEDSACSAAYWTASQATEIWSSPNAESIGNIGVVASVADVSQAAAQAGVKVHMFTTGPYKGMGTPGVPISAEHQAEMQRMVNVQFENFINVVSKGRKVSAEKAREWADGRWFTGPEALQMGLVDRLGSIEDLYQAISARMVGSSRPSSPPAGRFAASAPQNKPMSKLTDLLARLRGTPEAAQALGATAADLDALEAEASATTTLTQPGTDFAAELAALKAEREKDKAKQDALAATVLGTSALSFANQIIAENKAQPVQREKLAHAYKLAALSDGGGSVALTAEGAILEGSHVAALRDVYKDAPAHQHGGDVIPNGDPSATAKDGPMTSERRAHLLKLNPVGQAVLAKETSN